MVILGIDKESGFSHLYGLLSGRGTDFDKETHRSVFEVKPELTRQNALMIRHQNVAK